MRVASKLPAPITAKLDDDTAEKVRRNHEERLRRIELAPGMAIGVIKDVFLANGRSTPVPHGMGRRVSVWVTAPRRNGTGLTTPFIVRVDGSTDEVPSTPDPTQFVTLLAGGWGGTGVTVDILVL